MKWQFVRRKFFRRRRPKRRCKSCNVKRYTAHMEKLKAVVKMYKELTVDDRYSFSDAEMKLGHFCWPWTLVTQLNSDPGPRKLIKQVKTQKTWGSFLLIPPLIQLPPLHKSRNVLTHARVNFSQSETSSLLRGGGGGG